MIETKLLKLYLVEIIEFHSILSVSLAFLLSKNWYDRLKINLGPKLKKKPRKNGGKLEKGDLLI